MTYLSKDHEKAVEFLKQSNFDLALKHIEIALQNHKSHPNLLAERGTIYMYLKRKNEALEDMDLAVYLQPDNPYRYSSRAYVKDFFGDTSGAIEDYEKCIALDSEDVIAMNNLGLLIEKQGNRKKAEKYYKRADDYLKENPDWQSKIYTPDPVELTENVKIEPTSLMGQPETGSDLEANKKSVFTLVREVFTKKNMFLEYLKFVKNGFKISS